MRKYLFIIPSLVFTLSVSAQTKMLTMEDALVRNRTTLAPENLRQLQFIYGTEDYVYLKRVGDNEVWMKGNFTSSAEQRFLSLDDLNQKLKFAGTDGLTGMPMIQFNKSPEWMFSVNGGRFALNPTTNRLRVIIDKSIANKENVEESSAGFIAYVDNHNLFVSNGKNTNQVTTDGSKDIVYASSVHRDNK